MSEKTASGSTKYYEAAKYNKEILKDTPLREDEKHRVEAVALYKVPAEVLIQSEYFSSWFPHLSQEAGYVYLPESALPEDRISEFSPVVFISDGKRTASDQNNTLAISSSMLGYDPIDPFIQEFYPNYKGVGSNLTAVGYLLPRAKASIYPGQYIIPVDIGECRPIGGQSLLLAKNAEQFDEFLSTGINIKMAPADNTCKLPPLAVRGIMRTFRNLRKQVREFHPRTYGYRADKNNLQSRYTNPPISDFALVQEKRWLPSSIRGSGFINNTHLSNMRRMEMLNIEDNEFNLVIKRFYNDALRHLENYCGSLSDEGEGILTYLKIGDIDLYFEEEDLFNGWAHDIFLKDFVIAKTGLYFVDWETVGDSMMYEDELEKNSYIFTATLLREVILFLTMFTLARMKSSLTNIIISKTMLEDAYEEQMKKLFEVFNSSNYVEIEEKEDIISIQLKTGIPRNVCIKIDRQNLTIKPTLRPYLFI